MREDFISGKGEIVAVVRRLLKNDLIADLVAIVFFILLIFVTVQLAS